MSDVTPKIDPSTPPLSPALIGGEAAQGKNESRVVKNIVCLTEINPTVLEHIKIINWKTIGPTSSNLETEYKHYFWQMK